MNSLEEEREEFIMPKLTPIKRGQKQINVLDSPSKVQARSRLGSLLGQIRKGESSQTNSNELQNSRDQLDIYEEYDSKTGGTIRSRKMRREKRVVFELRGKPFGLRDTGRSESIYALCRKWMYGKDDEPLDQESGYLEEQEYEPHFNKSLDLMATREINALPPPLHEVPLMDPRPQKVMRFEPPANEEITSKEKTLEEYRRHWKRVKKNWLDYNQKRQLRYKNSLQLLRTVYGIAQQTQVP
uniref:Uncharacterized protein n=1 Tax=Meloidogyne enterolobii TaxID=390850 RepID=A0A6V7XEP5_MELEN|nr:unnamed protein product [Meloidogyne enterolobii]